MSYVRLSLSKRYTHVDIARGTPLTRCYTLIYDGATPETRFSYATHSFEISYALVGLVSNTLVIWPTILESVILPAYDSARQRFG